MCAASRQANFDALVFLSNATAAFGLNMAVFLLIGKTSALTMNVAGVIKDWLLIGLSVAIFKAQVCLVATPTETSACAHASRMAPLLHACRMHSCCL